MSKPIVVGVTKETGGYAKGSELGFANAADADKVLGDGNYKILRHTDTSEWTPPEAKPANVSVPVTEDKAK